MAAFEVRAQGARRNPAAAPARSLRRSTARRASIRRASARRRQSDSEARIIGFLVRHPESTIGDLAKSLNLDPDHVAIDLTQLTSTGEIRRASHGYSIQPPPGSPAE